MIVLQVRYQRADWSREGQLLVATRTGRLQIRNLEGDSPEILFEVDLSNLEPTSRPAPLGHSAGRGRP